MSDQPTIAFGGSYTLGKAIQAGVSVGGFEYEGRDYTYFKLR